jgi:hypothetical protein
MESMLRRYGKQNIKEEDPEVEPDKPRESTEFIVRTPYR